MRTACARRWRRHRDQAHRGVEAQPDGRPGAGRRGRGDPPGARAARRRGARTHLAERPAGRHGRRQLARRAGLRSRDAGCGGGVPDASRARGGRGYAAEVRRAAGVRRHRDLT